MHQNIIDREFPVPKNTSNSEDMVERVARAIGGEVAFYFSDEMCSPTKLAIKNEFRRQARAAIQAMIPLTPSDEMVEAACRGYIDSKYPTFKRHGPANIQSELGHMKAALQAALNLMGGGK